MSKQRSRSIGQKFLPQVPLAYLKVNPNPLLTSYLNDPVSIDEIIKFDEFNKNACINRTAFEEVENFSLLSNSYKPSSEEKGKEESSDLRSGIKSLFVETLTSLEEDKTTALNSFHLLLFKRLQIVTRVQEYQLLKIQLMQKKKKAFESLPMRVSYKTMFQNELTRNLDKAISKKDKKKGLFGKLSSQKHKTIHKILSKSIKPLIIRSRGMKEIHSYLLKFAQNKGRERKEREKSIMAVLLLAIGNGNLLEMLEILCFLIEFPSSTEILSSSTTEEEGIFVSAEEVKVMKAFDLYVKEKYSKTSNLDFIFEDRKYGVPKRNTHISEEHLFFYVLSRIQKVCVNYTEKSLEDQRLTELWIEYSLQPVTKTFQNLNYLLNKFCFDPTFVARLKPEKRIPTILSLVDILKLNLDCVSLWKRLGETNENLIKRLGKGEPTSLSKVQNLLYGILTQLKEITTDKVLALKVVHQVTSVITRGFTLFFPSVLEQKKYVLSLLKNLSSPLDKIILGKILQKLVDDSIFFYRFLIENMDKKTKETNDFISKLVKFTEDETLKLLTSEKRDELMVSIVKNVTKLLLLWQHFLAKRVTPIYTKFQQKFGKEENFESVAGKFFTKYCKIVIQSSLVILKKLTSGKVRKDKKYVNNFLLYSSVGKMLFPLLQNLIRLLWKDDNRVKYNLYSLTSFLYPLFLELMECFSKLNKMLGVKDKTFAYYVAETDHPYVGGLNEKITASFPEGEVFASSIVFHPRCRTAQSSDTLIISSVDPFAKRKVQPLKFSGSGNTIPVNPLVSLGNFINLNFTSNQQQTDWGMKCKILPLHKLNWVLETEKYIGWLGGRFSTYVISAFPFSEDEKKQGQWLNSRLFFNGLEGEKGGSGDKFQKIKNRFFRDIMKNKGSAAKLVKFMYYHLRVESFMLRDNEDVISSERAIIAVLMKHSDEIGSALRFTKKIVDVGEAFQTISDVPANLVQIWRSARAIRTWMIQQKQKRELENYTSLKKNILKRCKFLLTLKSATFSQTTYEQEDEIVSEKEGEKEGKSDEVEEVRKDFLRLAKKQKMVQSEIQNIKQLGETTFKFIQGDVKLEKLAGLLTMRKDRALCRQKAIDMFTSFINRTRFPSVKADIIRELFNVVTSLSFKKGEYVDFHYFNNIEGCGIEFYEKFTNSYHNFLKALFDGVDLNSKENVDSCLTRHILLACLISFKPSDVQWVLEFDFINKISPFLYSTVDGADDDTKGKGFKITSSEIEEKLDLSSRAWKSFRLLALRCVEILEAWEEGGEKYQVSVKKRMKIKKQLDVLRDKIFNLIFDEFENMIKNNKFGGTNLEEMLSLMVSLVHTESAQSSLSTSRFQKLVIPLLKVNNPKLQQLSLKLYGRLALSESTDKEEETLSFKATFINILFGLLGSYEMGLVFGKDIFNEQSNLIGLDLAKEIFVFIRKLIKVEKWKKPITVLLEQYLKDGGSLLAEMLKKKIRNLVKLPQNYQKKVKFILAAFVMISGLNYVPSENEYVRVILQGRLEEARIVLVEESKHQVKVVLKESCGIDRIQRVQSEYVIVETNEKIDPNLFKSSDIIKFITFICKEYGKILFSKNANDYGDNFHLVFSYLWMKSLEIIHDKLKEKEIKSALDLGILSNIINFAKNCTPISYGIDIKLHTCTFAFTGKKFANQVFYQCFTCNMGKDKAVCAYCAKNCHRGHALGTARKGEFFCDCGSSKGKTKCKSLKKPPEDPVLSLKRLESLLVRLRTFMPIVASRGDDETPSTFISQSNVKNQQSFLAPSRFVNSNKSTGYSINRRTSTVQFSWKHARGFSMIGTDHAIPPNYTGYYFEVEVLNYGKRRSGIAIGFSESVNRNKAWPQVLTKSFTYHIMLNHIYKGTQFFMQQNTYTNFRKGDVYGCEQKKKKKFTFHTLLLECAMYNAR